MDLMNRWEEKFYSYLITIFHFSIILFSLVKKLESPGDRG